MTLPLVSVLICTRDRPTDVEGAVRSVLASEGVELDVVVVDQSDGDLTAELLASLPSEAPVRHVRSSSRGVGAALEEGMELARSPYVIRTDDDCVVPPHWVAGMAAALDRSPLAGLVFCNVLAAPHDQTKGYVPRYEMAGPHVVRSVFQSCSGKGLGAGVGLRRAAVLDVGGFDAMMGPGGRFYSCEDWDIELRMLLRGWQVVHTPDPWVVHHGFRRFSEGRSHAIRDWLGIGACLGKLTRAGHLSALIVAAREVGLHALLPPLGDLVVLRRPRGLQRIISFGRGFAAGITAPVDPVFCRFIDDRRCGKT